MKIFVDKCPNFRWLKGVSAHLCYCLSIFLSVTALIDAFNKEKALVGASSEYCESYREIVWHLWWILGTDRYGSFSKWLFSLRPQRSDLHLYSQCSGGVFFPGTSEFDSVGTRHRIFYICKGGEVGLVLLLMMLKTLIIWLCWISRNLCKGCVVVLLSYVNGRQSSISG